MLRYIYLTLTFLFLWNFSHAFYSELFVLDPQRGWAWEQGTIEEATFTVDPQGLYTEVGVYLTFSARNTGFSAGEILEVDYYFELPAKAIINDSWLWIEDEIIKADIIDRWTASTIYEEIVGRRQDPSILVKEGDGQYRLRIFPLPAEGSRKVKISMLIPNNWTENNVSSILPTHLLQSSLHPVELEIRALLKNEWKNPRMLTGSGSEFVQVTDPNLGTYWSSFVPASSSTGSESLFFNVDAPLEDGLYLNRHTPEQIYQLVFLPSKALGLADAVPRKLSILLDYQSNNSRDISQAELLEKVMLYLLAHTSPSDSFNLFLADLFIEPVSPDWLPAHPDTILATFDRLGDNPLADYNNLPTLIGTGIDFVKRNGADGQIIIFSNSDSEGSQATANRLLDDVLELIGDDMIPIHVCDFQNNSVNYNWINNRNYRGNEYLYANLTRLTSGNFTSLLNCCPSLDEIVQTTFADATAFNGTFDLHTSLDDGLCYNRYHLHQISETVNLKSPIYEVGKYVGNFPFVIEAAGILNGNLFQNQFSIGESFINEADTLASEIWVGQRIAALEKQPATNQTVAEIIDLSIKERVLSRYTAFLALEPSRGGEVCENCQDETEGEGGVVSVEELSALDTLFQIQVFPNPFSENVTITIEHDSNIDQDDVSMGIYNGLGQLVRTYSINALPGTGTRWTLTWNGQNDGLDQMAGGIYHFILRTSGGQISRKLVYMPK